MLPRQRRDSQRADMSSVEIISQYATLLGKSPDLHSIAICANRRMKIPTSPARNLQLYWFLQYLYC